MGKGEHMSEPILRIEWKGTGRGYLYIRHGELETRITHFNDSWFSFEPSFENAVAKAMRELDRRREGAIKNKRRAQEMSERVARMEDKLLKAMREVT
jgi:hypothetical protein